MNASEWSDSARTADQVLYLDYDGVLHPDAVYLVRRYGVHLSQREAPGRQLFDAAIFLTEALDPYPKARIVLSTTWVRRLGFDKAKSSLPLNCPHASSVRPTTRVSDIETRLYRPRQRAGRRSLRMLNGAGHALGLQLMTGMKAGTSHIVTGSYFATPGRG